MIQKIGIENYKSIDKLEFELGGFNVFIGENGCGKSNIIEAIAFASSYPDLDNGKLSLKGVRVIEPIFFRNGFDTLKTSEDIKLKFTTSDGKYITEFIFSNLNEPYSVWKSELIINGAASIDLLIDNYKANLVKQQPDESSSNKKENDPIEVNDKWKLNDFFRGLKKAGNFIDNFIDVASKYKDFLIDASIPSFIIYAPENYFLRNYNIDSPYTQPLGTRGEGLLKLIKVIKKEKPEEYNEIVEQLHLIDWFSDIEITDDSLSGAEFKLNDKYLEDGIGGFDIKNANEGFFLLLFYITLFVSDYTPSFFAIDNIDTALNPKLCTKLIEVLTVLAKKHNKQALITTHNPSILDGINLNDDTQRLFAVSRNKTGYTRVNRIEKKPPLEGEQSLKLSEQFLRGYIGGLPKNF